MDEACVALLEYFDFSGGFCNEQMLPGSVEGYRFGVARVAENIFKEVFVKYEAIFDVCLYNVNLASKQLVFFVLPLIRLHDPQQIATQISNQRDLTHFYVLSGNYFWVI